MRECGSASEAEAAYRTSLGLADGDPDAHVQLGHLFKQQGRGDEAVAAYLRALELDPWLLHASQELIALGWTGHVAPPRCPAGKPSVVGTRRDASITRTLVIDIGDLLLHFRHSRLPTGIQRVQVQIVTGLLDERTREFELALVCFAPSRDFWVNVPEDLFSELASLATSGSATDDPSWREALAELTALLVHGEPTEFAPGSVLVDLGASWPHPNYFLRVRNAKIRCGLGFVPFVHDCVPVLMPEFCAAATVRSYFDWLLGVLSHADGFLVSSRSTAADLSKLAALHGHRISPQVIPLDGRFSIPTQTTDSAQRRNRIEPFVLLVSTFEPRKNHILAFKVWLKLIEMRRLRRTPRLVCVGHRGWDTDAALSFLRSSKSLQRRVRILTAIADADLATLYQRCLFTLYPSVYEGWGLPVTEALCYGKLPLVAKVSSLPEAGGEFAEYFDLDSPQDLLKKLELLIDDRDYRARREALIREKFRPREWSVIAKQIADYALTKQAVPCHGLPKSPPTVQTGRHYQIARCRETSIEAGLIAGEIFRTGEGWWAPEEWGCWLKNFEAELRFSLSQFGNTPCFLYVGLRGLPNCSVNFKLQAKTDAITVGGTLEVDEYGWPMLELAPGERDDVIVRITSDRRCNLAEISGGMDRRIVTLGVIGFHVGTEPGWRPAGESR